MNILENESLLKFINYISNLFIFSTLFVFIINYFGDAKSKIYKRRPKFASFLLKIGVTIICLHSLYLILSPIDAQTVNVSKVLVNMGLATLSTWLFLETFFKKGKLAF